MDEVERLWPDPDLRNDALLRLLGRVLGTPGDFEGEPVSLTTAQRHCLSATAAGLDWREAGEVLGISPYTVREHLTHARRLLAAKTTTQACAEALRRGLIS